jgi:hypothetical protein
MALVLKDRVKETTSTEGTGTLTLLGAAQGYQAFSSIGNGNTTYYCIQSVNDWEVGIGTVGAGTLTRDTVLASSNNGNRVGFGTGVKDVFCTYPASKIVSVDNFPVTGEFYTTTPNATVNVAAISPSVATTNGDFALIAKGTGAVLLSVPNNAASGGNKRGTYAVDFQRTRAGASQVASGSYATLIGGGNNTASGTRSTVAGGLANTASSTDTVVIGGNGNSAQSLYDVVIGGATNIASGSYSVAIGGDSNQANGFETSVIGSSQSNASGENSIILGGAFGTDRGIKGIFVTPASVGPLAGGSIKGSSQASILILAKETTDATPAVVTSNELSPSATNQIVLPNNSAFYFRGSVIANVTGGGNTKSWTFDGQIKRGANAAATTLTGSTVTSPYADAGASTWSVALSADTTNGGLAVTVTGQASTTIRWVCKIETTEVTY